MANFELSPAVATKAANDTGEIGSQMKAQMTTLTNQLDALLGGSAYQGRQAVAFVGTHETTMRFATRLSNDLNTMQEILTKVAQHTASKDDDAAQALSKLASASPVGLV
jgi:uncharacterized protein YukE